MKITIGNKTFEVSKDEQGGYPEEFKIPFEGTLRTAEEDSVFIENHKKDARKEGVEVAVKQYREEYGFQGRSIERLIEAVQNKTLEDAKIEPEEKNKKLLQTLKEKEEALTNQINLNKKKETEIRDIKRGYKLNSFINTVIPDNTILPKEDIAVILKNKLKFDFDENDNIVSLDTMGNILKDELANPKNPKDVVSLFFKDNQNYLKGVNGGAGGEDSKSKGSKKSIDDFISEMRDKDINPGTVEFNEELKKQNEAGLVDV